MKKFRAALTGIVLGGLTIIALFRPTIVRAVDCSSLAITANPPFSDITSGDQSSVNFTISGLDNPQAYTVRLLGGEAGHSNDTYQVGSNGSVSMTSPAATSWQSIDVIAANRTVNLSGPNISDECTLGSYSITPNKADNACKASISYQNIDNPSCVGINSDFTLKVTNATQNGSAYSGTAYISVTPGNTVNNDPMTITGGNGAKGMGKYSKAGTYTAKIGYGSTGFTGPNTTYAVNCSATFTIPVATCKPVGNVAAGQFKICQTVQGDPVAYDACIACSGESAENGGIWTALGCLSTNPSRLIPQLLRVAIGLAGGIALLIMLYGAFLITTSSGDPKAVQEGQEVFTNAVVGLVVILLSVVLLKVIGVDILGIPGL